MINIKILIIAGKIQIGGFSKSLINLLNCLTKYNIDVDLFLTQKSDSPLIEYIPKSVRIIENELIKEHRNNEEVFVKKLIAIILSGRVYYKLKFRFIRLLKYRDMNVPQKIVMKYQSIDDKLRVKYLKNFCDFFCEYDCVISWEELFCNYLLAEKVKAKKKIGYIHPDYISAQFCKEVDLPLLSKLDNIAVVSLSCKNTICSVMPEIAQKTVNIPNVIDVSQIRNASVEIIHDINTDKFTIVTVCRLQNVSKALERAIAISAKLRDIGLNFRWYVVGDGEDKEMLSHLISRNGLDDIFVLLGARDNPYPYMKKANIFVLQSYYEGRPIVVDEAIIIGTPVMVTNYTSANEQVNNGLYGLVVKNQKQDIFLKLKDIIENPKQLDPYKEILKNEKWDKMEDCAAFLTAIKD